MIAGFVYDSSDRFPLEEILLRSYEVWNCLNMHRGPLYGDAGGTRQLRDSANNRYRIEARKIVLPELIGSISAVGVDRTARMAVETVFGENSYVHFCAVFRLT
jgi:hypothetical protein